MAKNFRSLDDSGSFKRRGGDSNPSRNSSKNCTFHRLRRGIRRTGHAKAPHRPHFGEDYRCLAHPSGTDPDGNTGAGGNRSKIDLLAVPFFLGANQHSNRTRTLASSFHPLQSGPLAQFVRDPLPIGQQFLLHLAEQGILQPFEPGACLAQRHQRFFVGGAYLWQPGQLRLQFLVGGLKDLHRLGGGQGPQLFLPLQQLPGRFLSLLQCR